MILLVSGEGPSDIGSCINQQQRCSGEDFRPGPMSIIVDRLTEREVGYSMLDLRAMEFVGETALAHHSKQLPMTLSAGKKRDYETAYHFKSARALARLASSRKDEEACEVGAVLFRDADGTRSTERGLYEAKWDSIEGGFTAELFIHGVPMVPKPKSEAWLICAFKANPYQACADLEESLSGNDNSPEPAKAELELLLDAKGKKVVELSQMIADGEIVLDKIEMPSFHRFRKRLREVIHAMLKG